MKKQGTCDVCGGKFNYENEDYYRCDYCRTLLCVKDELEKEDIDKLLNAQKYRDEYKFDEALSCCEEVLKKHPNIERANFCAILAKYKIIYIEHDDKTKTATFLDPDIGDSTIADNEYYKRLSPELQKEIDVIEEKRKEVVRESKSSLYDIFLCFKKTKIENKKEKTPEAEWVDKVYRHLKRKYKVFYSEKCLKGNSERWDTIIYAALRTSTIMFVFGSSNENIESPWVKNEWKRYTIYRKEDPSKKINLISSQEVKHSETDGELNAVQGIPVIINEDNKKVDYKKLFKDIDEFIKKNHEKSRNINVVFDAGEEQRTNKKFKRAEKEYRDALKIDASFYKAHWGLVQCEYKAFDDYDIVKSKDKLDNHKSFEDTIKVLKQEILKQNKGKDAEEKLKQYEKVQLDQTKHNLSDYQRPNYIKWKEKTKVKRTIKKVVCGVCIAAVLAGGIFCGYDLANPFDYETVQNGIVINNTGFMYKAFKKNLSFDTYDNQPVTGIANNAFKGSDLKSVTFGETVTSIGENAFADCMKLTTVNFKNTEVTIGEGAFRNCQKLTEINFETPEESSENSAFEIKASAGKLVIGSEAFADCKSLSGIVLNGISSIGAKAFAGCSELKNITINPGGNLIIGKDAFAGISESAVINIPTVRESYFDELKEEYPQIKFVPYTRNAVEEVEYYIYQLGEINENSLEAIEKAEALYEALSNREKRQITNYDVLLDARLIYNVIDLIDKIGTVELESEESISDAENAYKKLNDSQRARVINNGKLTDARAVFNVMKAIAAIGEVNLNKGSEIENANSKYNELNENQRLQVKNYNTLVNAKQIYNVMDLINKIGSVSLNSGVDIINAEEAYEALTLTQRESITNYKDLQYARSVYDVMILINDLKGTINMKSQSAIEEAERAYGEMQRELQPRVTNYEELREARKVFETVKTINDIGTVSPENESAILAAEESYRLLTNNEKKRVGNYSVLTDARAVFNVMKAIAAIGDVSLNSGSKIENAESQYNELNENQRLQVKNYNTLVNAKQIYNVMDLINKIGSVSLSSGMDIIKAENAYEALSPEQKGSVTNHNELEYARSVYDVMILINDLKGTINMQSQSAIEKAEKAYGEMKRELQPRVTNYGELQEARKVFETVKAINDIGTVSPENEKAILAAEESYSSLSEGVRERVGNYSVLTDARAVFNVMKLIAAIGKDITVNSKSAIEQAEAAYDGLTPQQKNKVTNYATLQEARSDYDVAYVTELIKHLETVDENSKNAIDQAEAEYGKLDQSQKMKVKNYKTLQDAKLIYDVISKISLIKDITLESKTAIQAAERAYNALREDLREKVINYSLLEDAQKIYNVVELIASIQTVTKNSGTAIERAENAYSALLPAQQKRVSNYAFLTNARTAYEVVLLIDAIGVVNSYSRGSINNAKARYDQLTPAQQGLVSNYAVLQNALEELKIYDLMDKISALGTITLSSEQAIREAESAYNSLKEEQRKKVENYNTLKTARIIYDLMLAIRGIGTVKLGKGTSYDYRTVTSSTMTGILNDASIRNEIDSITFTSIVSITPEMWTNAFNSLSMVRYDLSSGSSGNYMVPAGKLTYCLVGTTTKTYSMQITVVTGEEVHIGFENFKFSYASNPLDTKNATNAYVKFFGTSSITATAEGASAVNSNNLEITLSGNSNTTIKGANGGSSAVDSEGKAGGIGIIANNLTIKGDMSVFTVIGGNGAAGTTGSDGKQGNDATAMAQKGENGGDGVNGGDGKAGAVAISASVLKITSVNVTLVGGDGGNGGNGGNGGKGGKGGRGDGGLTFEKPAPGAGGIGGTGGDGGKGGKGALPISVDSKGVSVTGGKLTLKVGKNGDGGNGGKGGTSGKYGDRHASDWGGYTGVKGGTGGKGGDCYATLSESELKNKLSGMMNSATSVIYEKNSEAKPGEGGAGGTGGEGGNAYYNNYVAWQQGQYKGKGPNGKDGDEGKDGSIISY